MQIIRKAPTALRHARATIAFDGTAGNGATGTATIFTLTGRVLIDLMSCYCTESLASAGGGTIEVGTASDTDAFFIGAAATSHVLDDWLAQAAASAAGAITVPASNTAGYSNAQANKAISENVIATIGTAAITDGTLVFDVWYFPLTDDGALA